MLQKQYLIITMLIMMMILFIFLKGVVSFFYWIKLLPDSQENYFKEYISVTFPYIKYTIAKTVQNKLNYNTYLQFPNNPPKVIWFYPICFYKVVTVSDFYFLFK